MYNKCAIFDDCTVYIDEEEGFVKLVRNDKGLEAANLENSVKSLKKKIDRDRTIDIITKFDSKGVFK